MMIRIRIAGILCSTTCVLAAQAVGQAQEVSELARQAAPTPTFPSQVGLVTLDVVVFDAKGNPVRGLTRGDFILKESGHVRDVVAFEPIALAPSNTAPAATPTPRITPAVAPTSGGHATFLVVFDDVHLTKPGAHAAREGLTRFLRESAWGGDHVTIVSTATGVAWGGVMPAAREELRGFTAGLEGRLRPAEGMTEDEAQRIAEYADAAILKRVMGRYLAQSLCAPAPSPCAEQVTNEARTYQQRWRSERTASLEVMRQAVQGLAPLRGRKEVLLLTEGFIHDDDDDAYRRLVAQATALDAAFYFIDSRRPEALPVAADASARGELQVPEIDRHLSKTNPLNTQFVQDENLIAKAFEEIVVARDFQNQRTRRFPVIGIETIADETGGFVARNDPAEGLARAAREARSYYLIGYPATPDAAVDPRKIEVQVAGRGRIVRLRRSYRAPTPALAQPGPAPPGVAPDSIEARGQAPLAKDPPAPPSVITTPWEAGVGVPVPPDIAPILERAGRYVVEYSKVFSKLLAQEDYRQVYEDPKWPETRYSHADIVFITLPGAIPWATFRDVYDVDGNAVRDRTARLEKLFLESSGADTVARADAILSESSRFNLGPILRTVNIPTLALLFLHPDNQGRFAFERKGGTKIAGVDAVQVAFVERMRPTLVGCKPGGGESLGKVPAGGRIWIDPKTEHVMKTTVVGCASGGDVPASGRIWIEPETGAVLRTDANYDFTLEKPRQDQRVHAHIVTDYKREEALDILAPSEMHETYQLPVDTTRGFGIFDDARDESASVSITAVARYSAYRRFQVTTDEAYRPKE